MSGDSDTYVFTPGEADQIFQEIVKASVGANATMHLLDASGLFVADAGRLKKGGDGCSHNHSDTTKSNYCGNQHCISGVDFSKAVTKGKGHLSISSMAFGYPGEEHGRFCRFWIVYNARTDSVTVTTSKPSNK